MIYTSPGKSCVNTVQPSRYRGMGLKFILDYIHQTDIFLLSLLLSLLAVFNLVVGRYMFACF